VNEIVVAIRYLSGCYSCYVGHHCQSIGVGCENYFRVYFNFWLWKQAYAQL